MPYREKKIISGQMVEVEIYPISLKEKNLPRKKKAKESPPKLKNLNDKNAKKHFIRIVNTNFTDKDIVIHLTYSNDKLPKTLDEAKRDAANFIRRLNHYRKKNNLPAMKYIIVTEYHEPDTNDKRKRIRIHHHIILSGMDRDIAESFWGKGRANADRLQSDEFGFEGLARYLCKDPQGYKRWTQSKNIEQPDYKPPNDNKYSRRKVQEMARNSDDREMFEKKYPKFIFNDCRVEVNPVTGLTSLYIRMRLRADQIVRPKRE